MPRRTARSRARSARKQVGRIASEALPPAQKAAQGYAAAQGPNPAVTAADDIVGNAAKLVHNAPAGERAHVANVVERLGAALNEGKLVANDPLRQVIGTAANSAPGSNAYKGAMAHLTRAAEVLERVPLAPNSALAFDPPPPQNAAQVAANQQANATGTPLPGTEADARLPMLDTELVDADLYYRQDNRGVMQRAFDGLSLQQRQANQPLTIESSKSSVNALAQELTEATARPGTTTQVGRQQAWQQLGSDDAPRQVKANAANPDGLHQVLEPKALSELSKMAGDPHARNITIGDRSYSIAELQQIQAARQPEVDARVAKAIQAKVDSGQTVTQAMRDGITMGNMKAVHGNTPPSALPDGTPVGQANPKLGPLAQPPEMPSAKQGGLIGAAGALGISTATALADGKVSADEAKSIAGHTAAGGALGAISAKAERVVTPAIERAIVARSGGGAAAAGASNAVGLSMASRLAGSTVVGAAVSAGVSVWQNREGLAKGDSKAIGNVTADTAVGAGSVAAGVAAGAAIGSVVPVAGTAVGAVAGLAVGVAITYGAEISGARDWAADKIADGVDAVKNVASDAWNGLKGLF